MTRIKRNIIKNFLDEFIEKIFSTLEIINEREKEI